MTIWFGLIWSKKKNICSSSALEFVYNVFYRTLWRTSEKDSLRPSFCIRDIFEKISRKFSFYRDLWLIHTTLRRPPENFLRLSFCKIFHLRNFLRISSNLRKLFLRVSMYFVLRWSLVELTYVKLTFINRSLL